MAASEELRSTARTSPFVTCPQKGTLRVRFAKSKDAPQDEEAYFFSVVLRGFMLVVSELVPEPDDVAGPA